MAEGMLADASTLIYLAKAEVLPMTGRIVGSLRVAPAVWEEAVVVGTRRRHQDAMRLQRASQEGLLRRVIWGRAFDRRARALASRHGLGIGECQVLTLATQGENVLMDDGRASRLALGLGVLPVSTLFLPGMGLRKHAIRLSEARDMLRALANVVGVRADTLARIESALSEDS